MFTSLLFSKVTTVTRNGTASCVCRQPITTGPGSTTGQSWLKDCNGIYHRTGGANDNQWCNYKHKFPTSKIAEYSGRLLEIDAPECWKTHMYTPMLS